MTSKKFRKPYLGRLDKLPVNHKVEMFVGLLLHGTDDPRVGMAQVGNGDA